MSVTDSSSILSYLGASLALAVVPIIFLLVSPFLKLSIVFGVLKTGFGTQGVPGAAATGALALILSLHILGPVIQESYKLVDQMPEPPRESSKLLDYYLTNGRETLRPLETFLERHSGSSELSFFNNPETPKLCALIPAFVLSELKRGFEMALILFVPFFVIDMAVTTFLTALGMMMVNPVTVSFPLKLLLFVNCNGWLELTKALLGGY
jgi:type III secretory pathway component EscR